MKRQGVLFGKGRRRPAQTGMDNDIFSSVVEYSTEDKVENPYSLIMELGGEDSDVGGLISLMFGRKVGMEDLDILKI